MYLNKIKVGSSLIFSYLLFFGNIAQAQTVDGYFIRTNPNLNSRAVGLTDSSCQLTGRYDGNMRYVQCDRFEGWVSRMGVEEQYRQAGTSTLVNAPGKATTNSTPPTSSSNLIANPAVFTSSGVGNSTSRAETPAAAVRPVTPGVTGLENITNFREAILNLTTSRVQEARVIRARQGQRDNVNLVALPRAQSANDPNGSPLCGAHQPSRLFNEGRGQLYFTPTAGCLMTAVAQRWRREHCPDNAPDCRLVVGDGSHGEEVPRSWPHNNHRAGACVDVYLPRRAGGNLTDQAGNQGSYSPERTRALIQIMTDYGASPNIHQAGATPGTGVVFDRGGPHTVRVGGHSNHIHVCFRDNASNRRRCDNTTFDTNLCPELSSQPSIMADEQPESPSRAAGVAL